MTFSKLIYTIKWWDMVINLSSIYKDTKHIYAVDSQRKLCHHFAFLVVSCVCWRSDLWSDEMTKQLYFTRNQFQITHTVLDSLPSGRTFGLPKVLDLRIVNLINVNYLKVVVGVEYAATRQKLFSWNNKVWRTFFHFADQFIILIDCHWWNECRKVF